MVGSLKVKEDFDVDVEDVQSDSSAPSEPMAFEEVSDDDINQSVNELLQALSGQSTRTATLDDAARFLAEHDDEQSAESDDELEDEDDGVLTLDALLLRKKALSNSVNHDGADDHDDNHNNHDDDWLTQDRAERLTSTDPLQLLFREMDRFPLLSAEAENKLAIRCQQGDKDAERLFLSSNLRLVVHVAKKYMSSGIPLMDLVADGNIGLLEAVRRFDPDKGFRFSTYATWWVRQAVQRSVHNMSRTIRVPVHMSQLFNKMHRVERDLKQQGLPADDDAIAEVMNIDVRRLKMIRESVVNVLSLDLPTGEDGTNSLMDQMSDDSADGGWSNLLKSGSSGWLKEAMGRLTEKERYVLRARFGIGLSSDMTLDEVGASLSLTRERIRQIEGKALRRLRYFFSNKGIDESELLGNS